MSMILHLIATQRPHRLILAASVCAAFLATNAVVAQTRRQVMVVDDGSGPMVLQFSLPNVKDLQTPDFVRSDLPTINCTLKLEAAQRLSVQNLLEDYLRAFNALVKEALPAATMSGGRPMIAFGSGESPVGPEGPGGEIDNLILETLGGAAGLEGIDVDIDGPGTIRVSIEAGARIERQSDRDDGEDVVEVSSDSGTGDGAPQAGVTISVQMPDGVELPEEVKQKLQAQVKELANKLQARLEEDALQGRGPLAEGNDPYAAMEKKLRHIDELNTKIEKFRAAKTRLKQDFVGTVQGQLSDAQIDRWPQLDRALTRQKTLSKGQFDGERTNLLTVLETLDLPDQNMEALADVLENYEITLHDALVRRNTFDADLNQRIDKAVRQQKPDEALRLVDRGIGYRVAVRDINEQFTEAIASQLDGESAAAFRAAALKVSYPRIYGSTIAQRAFTQVGKLRGIDADTRSAITAVRAAYNAQLESMNDKLRRTVRKYQPQQARQAIQNVAKTMKSGVARVGDFSHPNDPIIEAFGNRAHLDERYLKQLYALLTPAQVQKLPNLPSQVGGSFVIEESSGDPDY